MESGLTPTSSQKNWTSKGGHVIPTSVWTDSLLRTNGKQAPSIKVILRICKETSTYQSHLSQKDNQQ
jgi:hypothetical protein